MNQLRTALAELPGVEKKNMGGEISPTASAAEKEAEIQAAVVLAKKFTRNEDEAWRRIHNSLRRIAFAEDSTYSFPRGGQTVSGPSVYLAREMARAWGNIRYGHSIVRDERDMMVIRGWAWDLETNAQSSAEDSFQKLVQRKVDSGRKAEDGRVIKETRWVAPDERDLRELVNRRAAMLVRNCILQMLPSDFVDQAVDEAGVTLKKAAADDPDGARKKIISAFSDIGVSVAGLEQFLGHPVGESSPIEIAHLRLLYKGIFEGATTWKEALAAKTGTAEKPESAPTVSAAASKTEALAEKLRSEAEVKAAQAAVEAGNPPAPTTPPAATIPTEAVPSPSIAEKPKVNAVARARALGIEAVAREVLQDHLGPDKPVRDQDVDGFLWAACEVVNQDPDPYAIKDTPQAKKVEAVLRKKGAAEAFFKGASA